MLYLPWSSSEINYAVFLLWLTGTPNNVLFFTTYSLGQREQSTLARCPSRFLHPLCSSLCHKPVPQAAPGASWLPNHRKCPRASNSAVAQVYRVAEAVWSGRLYSHLTSLILTPLGDIIYLNAAGQPMVILNSQKIAADLLDRRAGIYSDRPRNIVASDIMTGGLLVVFTRYNDMFVYLILTLAGMT
jgi:hypothetical protein